MAKKPTALPSSDPGSRIDNPYTPGEAFDPAPDPSAATIVKLWGGGEHGRAMATFKTIAGTISSADYDDIRAKCPGWDELLAQS